MAARGLGLFTERLVLRSGCAQISAWLCSLPQSAAVARPLGRSQRIDVREPAPQPCRCMHSRMRARTLAAASLPQRAHPLTALRNNVCVLQLHGRCWPLAQGGGVVALAVGRRLSAKCAAHRLRQRLGLPAASCPPPSALKSTCENLTVPQPPPYYCYIRFY